MTEYNCDRCGAKTPILYHRPSDQLMLCEDCFIHEYGRTSPVSRRVSA